MQAYQWGASGYGMRPTSPFSDSTCRLWSFEFPNSVSKPPLVQQRAVSILTGGELEAGSKVTGYSCLPELNLQSDHDKRQQGRTSMLCKQLW